MTDIDVTEIRIILEDLSEEQLINILEKNGYTNKGKKNVLIREIMTKISHDIVIQELDDLLLYYFYFFYFYRTFIFLLILLLFLYPITYKNTHCFFY
nr:hypothetical protein [uncultured Methanobrevibacter sp.]